VKVRVLSLDDAAAALAAVETALSRWTDEAAAKARAAEVLASELAEAQARAGDDLLDDDDPEALTRIAADLEQRRVEQGVAAQAASRAGERLVAAQRDVLRARGAALRSRGADLARVVAERTARTGRMLAALAEFETVPYAPASRVDALGLGNRHTPMTLTQRMQRRAEWLTGEGSRLGYVADHGADAVVSAMAGSAMEPLDDTERAAAPPPAEVVVPASATAES